MTADFGLVRKFLPRGFGFVRSCLDGKESFFHISRVKDGLLREQLDGDWESVSKAPLWYGIETTSKGLEATSLHSNLDEAPEEWKISFVDRALFRLNNGPATYISEDLKHVVACLFRFRSVIGHRMNEALSSRVVKNHPLDIIDLLNDMERAHLAAELNLESIWLNIDAELSSWVPDVTVCLLGDNEFRRYSEARSQLQADRRKREHEHAKNRAAEEEARAADRRREEERELSDLVSRYRPNPRGIRTQPRLQSVCISCGSTNVVPIWQSFGPNRSCQNCGTTWYINHCWSCKNARVDSRDPETPSCPVCGWHKCAFCGSCRLSGCTTNPYSRGYTFENAFAHDGSALTRSPCAMCGSQPGVHDAGFGRICEICFDSL